jgi:hypothetical protein
MSDETRTAKKAKEERKRPTVPELGQVGASPVGPIGIVLMMAYEILLGISLLYSLLAFWPSPTPAGGSAATSSPVTFLFWTFPISDEVRLLLIVGLAGALGSLVHVFRSLSWYVGNRKLVRSWLVKYVLLPFVGTTLALVFYFVIRAGFFSPAGPVEQTNPFHLAALAALAGMFSDQVAEKLKEVLETLLATPEGRRGADHVPPGQRAEAEPQEEEQGHVSGGE